jgi:tetratricopeptide (TPR) repeat protein
MFNIFKSNKKNFGWQDQKRYPEPKNKVRGNFLDKPINKISNFFDSLSQSVISEHGVIKKKIKNLYQSNYDLGLQHLNNGNVREAIFRFRIIKKFWPHIYDAYYYLIYCLVLDNNLTEAQKIIDDLLIKNPSDKEKINKLLAQNS